MEAQNDFELLETEEVALNNLQIYQQDKALIDMQISTAKRYPRNLQNAIDKSIMLVTRSKEVAESCTYSLRKGKLISGPSVNLARILVQRMGNMRAESRIVGFDDKHVTAEAVCFDLESNYAMRTQMKKSIVGNSGIYSADLQVITGNACAAIAFRNAVFNVIGQDIVDIVYTAVKQKIVGDVSDENKLIARRTAIFEGFKKNYPSFNLTDTEIAASVGKSSISNIDKDDILTLIGFEKSLRDGEQSVETLFKSSNMKAKVNTKLEDKSDERIIKLIQSCKTKGALEKLLKDCTSTEAKLAYDEKFKTFK